MPEPFAPRLVNPFPTVLDLTGKLFPWDGVQPVFLRIAGADNFCLPCFSSKEHLDDFMGKIGAAFRSIKQIEDGAEFLTSFTSKHRKDLRIIFDPYFLPNGRIRYTQVLWPEEEKS